MIRYARLWCHLVAAGLQDQHDPRALVLKGADECLRLRKPADRTRSPAVIGRA